ncbi:unnamed protein product [Brassica rapa subsp. narinosa]|uniref:(rape) hypothetical protein n=1 Tax=Brassica napus TaxID=3708 RepID=A0A816P850_BRANA|nr:unnamed protein product [Brassica napus]
MHKFRALFKKSMVFMFMVFRFELSLSISGRWNKNAGFFNRRDVLLCLNKVFLLSVSYTGSYVSFLHICSLGFWGLLVKLSHLSLYLYILGCCFSGVGGSIGLDFGLRIGQAVGALWRSVEARFGG